MKSTGLFSRLSTRITIGALFLVIGGGIALLYLIGISRQEVVMAQQQSALTEALYHNSSKLQQAIDVLRQDVLFLSSTPPVSGIIRAALNNGFDVRENSSRAKWERRLQEIFAAFSTAHPDYYQICYVGVADGGREIVHIDNRSGRIEVTSQDKLQKKDERDYVKAALGLRNREVYLSEIGPNQEWAWAEHLTTLRAATPVYAPSGEIFGVVVINMAANGLLKLVKESLPPGTRSYVANMQGDYLLHPEFDMALGSELWRDNRIMQDFPVIETLLGVSATDHLPVTRVAGSSGVQYLTAKRIHFDKRQPEHFLLLAYAIPDVLTAEQMHSVLDRKVIIGGLAAVLLAAAMVWFMLRHIFSPLDQLTRTAGRIAAGDFGIVLPTGGSGEVGALVNAIRNMLDVIGRREHGLRIAASAFETQEAIMITDSSSKILQVNRAFSEITGYEAMEVEGHNPRILSPDRRDTAFYKEMWETLLHTGKWSGELWSRRKNGEAYPRWQTITAVRNSNGEATHYVSIFSDIGQRKQAEDEIRKLVHELGRQNEELQLYKSRIEEEREIAHGLMQQFSALDEINDPLVRFYMKPMDEFSGDLIAAARTPDGRLHVLLADGTGHGLNAALSVAPLAQLFYQMTRKGFDITGIATEMNHRVRSYLPLPRFVAVALVSVEAELGISTERGTIRVWNGGCPPVSLFQSDSAAIYHFSSRHLPMGILGRESFDSSVEYYEYTGVHGQLLVCSDGLTELPMKSGKQLGQTGLLYRAASSKKRFEKITRLIDKELQHNQPTDDISLILVDLPQAMPVVKSQQVDMAECSDASQMLNEWSFSLTLTAAQIRRLDIVPLLLNVAGQFEEARIDGKLFIVLAELFNNALDHGLLKLSSALKNETNGMELYFEERAARLSRLEQGRIEVHLEKLFYSGSNGIRIYFRDSGGGFDHAGMHLHDACARHGRGITLLRGLCHRLEYLGDGSEVVAILTV